MKQLFFCALMVLTLSAVSVRAQYVDRTKVTEAVPAIATLQSAATANGDGSTLDISGYSSVSFVITGTFSATVNFEATGDDTNWVALQTVQIGTSTISTTSTSTGTFSATIGSLKTVRARISGYASGSVTVIARANLTRGVNPQVVTGKVGVTDASGNEITSTSNALDINIKSGNPTTITATQATGTNLHTVVDSGAVNATLQAGSALVGKVGIDQTTPGTTNKVTVGSDVVHTVIDSGTTAVTQATASNLNADANLKTVGGNAVSTVATGVQKVGIADSGGTAFLSAASALNSTGGGLLAVQVAGQFDDTSPTSITENQFGNLRMSANRNLYGTIRDAAGNERGANVDGNNNLGVVLPAETTKVIGTVNVAGSQSIAVTQGTATSLKTQAEAYQEGTAVGAANPMQVSLANNGANAVAVKVDGSAVTQPTSNANLDASVAANDATLPTKVLLIGVEANSGQPAAATTGNQRRLVGSPDGALYTRLGSPVTWTCGVNGVAASLSQCQAAPGAGLKLYITGLYVQTTTTTSGTYALQTGTGSNCGTGTAALFPVSSTSNRFNAPITSNAMASVIFPVPLVAPANTAVCLIGVATNTISAQLIGFTAP